LNVTLENEKLCLRFDPEVNAFKALIYKESNENVIKKVLPDTCFRLIELDGKTKEKRELNPGNLTKSAVVRDGKMQTLELHYESVLQGKTEIAVAVDIQVVLEDGQNETNWRISIENHSQELQIIEIVFPILKGIYLGEAWEDDVLIYPHHAGEKTSAPIRTCTSTRFTSFNRSRVTKEKNYWEREINYCGLASMMWMYYYDAQYGLYFGSHDEDFLVTGLRVESGGTEDPWLGLAFRKHQKIATGEVWQSAPAVIALNNQDWHWGAQRYRKWFLSQVKMQDSPAMLAHEVTLNQYYNLKRQGEVMHRFADILHIYEKGQTLFDARHLFLASWNRGGFDRDYPEFQPDMELGTPLSLAHACQQVRKKGGLVTFYINSRIFHLQSDFFESLGRKWGIKKPNGELYIEQYGPETFSVNCPANAAWQDLIADTAEWMVRSYHANGIYLDQLGSAEPFACYDAAHSHAQSGLFNQGYMAVLRDVRERLKRIDEQAFLMIENCGDLYSSQVWGSLTWNGEDYDEFYTLFKYTFPEVMQVHMVNPIATLEEPKRQEKFFADMERALRLGAMFWLGVDKFDEDSSYLRYTEQAIRLRKELNPFFMEGRFVDDEGLASISGKLQVAHWLLQSGDHLLVIGNPKQIKEGAVDINLMAETITIAAEGNIEDANEGADCEKVGDERWRVHVAPQRVSYVVLQEVR